MRDCLKKGFLLVALIFTPLCAMAVGNESLKVGFVNIRKIMTQAPQLDQIQKTLANDFEAENTAIITLRNEIAQLATRYEKENSDVKLIELQRLIADKQEVLDKAQQSLRDEYNLHRNEALGKLQILIVRMVTEVSRTKNLDIVFNNTGVIYINGRIDITPAVLSRLEKEKID